MGKKIIFPRKGRNKKSADHSIALFQPSRNQWQHQRVSQAKYCLCHRWDTTQLEDVSLWSFSITVDSRVDVNDHSQCWFNFVKFGEELSMARLLKKMNNPYLAEDGTVLSDFLGMPAITKSPILYCDNWLKKKKKSSCEMKQSFCSSTM